MQTTKSLWATCTSLFVLGAALGMFIARGESLNSRELLIFSLLALLAVIVAIGAALLYGYSLRRPIPKKTYQFILLQIDVCFLFILSGFVTGGVAVTQFTFL